VRKKLPGILSLFLLLLAYILVFPVFEQSRQTVSRFELQELTLPPFVSRFLALEFRSVAADYLFVRTTQFYGGKTQNSEETPRGTWLWLYSNLYVVTDLDPYFEDPYYFGNAVLTWGGQMFTQANKLLQRGTEARDWDWQLPFFMGFNKFYFLNDNKGGADDLLMAAQRPGAPPFLPSLVSRLYNNAGKTEIAIALLTDFRRNEKSDQLKKIYEVRIEALNKILSLERAVAQYERTFRKRPANIAVLLRSGVLREVPHDPYGGRFYLDKDGSIKTTSKLAFKPRQAAQQK
jgi:hypothetical protein